LELICLSNAPPCVLPVELREQGPRRIEVRPAPGQGQAKEDFLHPPAAAGGALPRSAGGFRDFLQLRSLE
jgi:hypothetical protein